MVYTCLSISIPLIASERLERLETVLSSRSPCPRRDHVLTTIRQLRCPAEIPTASLLGKRKRDTVSWRTDVHTTVTNWFFDNPVWMSNTGEPSDPEWCAQVIEAISHSLPVLVLLIFLVVPCQLLTVCPGYTMTPLRIPVLSSRSNSPDFPVF